MTKTIGSALLIAGAVSLSVLGVAGTASAAEADISVFPNLDQCSAAGNSMFGGRGGDGWWCIPADPENYSPNQPHLLRRGGGPA
ncbi:hypothetical protein ACWDYH_03360 [Nocardia goodfellowii]